jgi:NitT/TauT family transport system permease protein
MASLSVVLVSLLQAYEGASSVAKIHLIFAKTLGAKDRRVIKYIISPGALRHVLAGLKMNIGFAIMGTFIAEFISSEYGVGHYIIKAGGTYDTARVFVGIFTMGAMSLAAQFFLKRCLGDNFT